MDHSQIAAWVWWVVAGVQIWGLVSASLVRATSEKTPQLICHLLFFASFTTVAVVTVGCLAAGSHGWVFSGATLGWMAICATWDAGLSTPEVAS